LTLGYSDRIGRIRMHDQRRWCRRHMRSQSPGMARKFQRLLGHRSPAFVPDNSRSRSANAVNPLLDVTSGSNVRHKTCRRLLFRLPSTPVQTEVLVLELLLALESSCATPDEGVANVAPDPRQRGAAHREPDQQFYIGIARPRIA